MAVTAHIYNHVTESLGDASIDLDGHTFKAILVNGYTFDATDAVLADVSASQIANGNGYTTGGLTLTSVTWNRSGSKTVFDAADAEWTASGGSMATSDGMIVYDDTVAGDPVLWYVDFDSSRTPAAGDKLIVSFDATNGLFSVDLA